jgi:CubicO group peptidase (beta-lactamase class C family)
METSIGHEMALEALRAVSANAVGQGHIPGVATLVWRRGAIVHEDAAGLRDVESALPVERSTIFAIASMSKPLTVVLALTLVEEGKLRLGDAITRWAPEFDSMRVLRRVDGPLDETEPAPRAITIEDLMTHRSGLAYGFATPGPLGRELRARFGTGISSDLGPDAWLAKLASLPLAHAPGECFCYGHSTDVLGFVVARAAGTTLRDALHERVLDPLGMSDTDFWVPPAKRKRFAQIYRSPSVHDFTRAPIPQFVADAPPAYTSGGQGLVSTADDYLTFARLLLGGGAVGRVRVLKPDTVKLMLTDRLSAAQRSTHFMGRPFFRGKGFGLGVSVVDDPEQVEGPAGRGSFSWPGGFGGWWQADPENDLVLLWLQQCVPESPPGGAQADPYWPGERARTDFRERAYAAFAS